MQKFARSGRQVECKNLLGAAVVLSIHLTRLCSFTFFSFSLVRSFKTIYKVALYALLFQVLFYNAGYVTRKNKLKFQRC
jgi:hypothetical protein